MNDPSKSWGLLNPESFNLSFEQQFKLKQLETQAQQISRQDLEQYFVEQCRLLMTKDNILRDFLKKNA